MAQQPPVPFVPREEAAPAPTERPAGLWVDALLAIPNGLNDSASMGLRRVVPRHLRHPCRDRRQPRGSRAGAGLERAVSEARPRVPGAARGPYIKGAGERAATPSPAARS